MGDTDESGGLSGAELVTSLLRLKGVAKATQVALLAKDISRLCHRTKTQMNHIVTHLEWIAQVVEASHFNGNGDGRLIEVGPPPSSMPLDDFREDELTAHER